MMPPRACEKRKMSTLEKVVIFIVFAHYVVTLIDLLAV